MQAALYEGARVADKGPAVDCDVEGCFRPSARGGLCWGHVKRRQRQLSVRVPLFERSRTPRERVLECVYDLSELKTSDDTGWTKALKRLRMAILRYYRANSKRAQYVSRAHKPRWATRSKA